MRGTVSGIRSLYGLFKVLKCNHQHGHFCPFVYIEYYSAGDIFTKFVKCYPLARFASSRCSELSAAFGDLRACYRGRVRITVALASAVIVSLAVFCQRKQLTRFARSLIQGSRPPTATFEHFTGEGVMVTVALASAMI